ncbi:MAG: hypothetical protein VZR26_06005, partial [Erysipelotrichaceae bacterium]|nr:hypothetical protein [Erysipelotrichaceae bacterium]
MGLFLRVTAEEGEIFTARPDENGFLHVEDTSLIDEDGNVVQLRGISAHGLTWYPDYINSK